MVLLYLKFWLGDVTWESHPHVSIQNFDFIIIITVVLLNIYYELDIIPCSFYILSLPWKESKRNLRLGEVNLLTQGNKASRST